MNWPLQKMSTPRRCYSELQGLRTINERFDYLVLRGAVGKSTFGFDRWLNQEFYQSREWRMAREAVIVRDLGCDLGIEGYEIYQGLLVHHMNPITPDDLVLGARTVLDPEYLITTSKATHNAIHYGDRTLLPLVPVDRRPDDTRLW
jgi:hypothetical protein